MAANAAYDKLDRPADSEDSDSGIEKDSERRRILRSSEDARRHDEETLNAEDEAERLLAGQETASSSRSPGGFSRDAREARRQRRRADGKRRKRRRNGEKSEESELMYAMEEGGRASESSSGNSSEADLQRPAALQGRKEKRVSRFARFTAIHLVIVAAFLALLYGAYHASTHKTRASKSPYTPQTLSNGTHTFLPTTLLISLDGFRADFLHRNLTPALSSFIRSGVSPKFMLPSFPSLTFPNHFTLVTGLHPESHGIVGNTFYDPAFEEEFDYGHPDHSMQPKWWQAEPLWVRAEMEGVKSAIHMWPGSEAGIGGEEGRPMAVDEFKQDEDLEIKVNRVLAWLDAADEQRPQFIAAYVPNVDADGHLFGPNSTEIRSTIKEVDGMLGKMFADIDERNLTGIVNIVIVSDHGMATTSNERLIQFEDLVDPADVQVEHTDGWPLYGLRLEDDSELNLIKVYNDLFAKSNLPEYRHAFDVYLRDENMPDRFHFSSTDRIAPLWIVPKVGWAIVTKDEFNIQIAGDQGLTYHPKGLHGYDNQHPLMRAMFAARGPAFPHVPGSELAPFQNTEVYNIVCDSLGLEPRPNNGTLRLPLQTQGTHDFAAVQDAVHDLPANGEGADNVDDTVPFLPPVVPNLASPGPPQTPSALSPSSVPSSPPPSAAATTTTTEQPADQTVPERPIVHDGLDGEDDEESDRNLWAQWVKGKIAAIKEWATALLHDKGGTADDDGDGGGGGAGGSHRG